MLPGKPRFDGSDDEFRGGPADLSGEWAIVHQPDGEESRTPETFIFRDEGGDVGWNTFPYGSAMPPEGASRFGGEVAIRWPDIFVAGGNESGTYVFREIPAQGFHVATRIQALDSFMGSGPAGSFAKSSEFLLQHARSHDRDASVVNVFQRRSDGSYEHFAVLAAKNGESLGREIAISGRRVLVGANGNGTVHYFVIPANVLHRRASRTLSIAAMARVDPQRRQPVRHRASRHFARVSPDQRRYRSACRARRE